MANKTTVEKGGTKAERVAALVSEKAEMEVEAAKFAKERGEAESKHRAAKKRVGEIVAKIAAIAME